MLNKYLCTCIKYIYIDMLWINGQFNMHAKFYAKQDS